MNEKKLQYQLSNGTWINCDSRTDEFTNYAEKFINNHPNKEVLLDGYETVSERLSSGKQVPTGTDWYDKIRYEPAPRPIVQQEVVKCDCGCTIPKISVMSASIGSSCPDCYDRMSC